VLLDTRGMDRMLHFDRVAGLIEVEAGIQWPAHVGENPRGPHTVGTLVRRSTPLTMERSS
jgi:hypothetical protein